MNYHNSRRSPGNFRSGGGGGGQRRPFDSPPRRSPSRGGGGGFRPLGGPAGADGFRPMTGGGGPGGFGFNDHQVPPPLSGQKRGFPFAGRGGSPGECSSCLLLKVGILLFNLIIWTS